MLGYSAEKPIAVAFSLFRNSSTRISLAKPGSDRGRSGWNFLTWSFFTGMLMGFSQLFGAAAEAAEAGGGPVSQGGEADPAPRGLASDRTPDAGVGGEGESHAAAVTETAAPAGESVAAEVAPAALGEAPMAALDTGGQAAGHPGSGSSADVFLEVGAPGVGTVAAPSMSAGTSIPDITGGHGHDPADPGNGPIGDVIEDIVEDAADVVDDVAGTIEEVAEAATDIIDDVLDGVADIVGEVAEVVGGIIETVTDVLSGVLDGTTDIIGGVTGTLGGILDAVTGTVHDLLGGVTDVMGEVTDTVDGIVGAATDAVGDVADAVSGVAETVTGTVEDVLGSVTDALGDVTDATDGLLDGVTGIVDDVAESITETVGGVTGVVGTMTESASEVVGGLACTVESVAESIVGNGLDALGEAIAGAAAPVAGLVSDVTAIADAAPVLGALGLVSSGGTIACPDGQASDSGGGTDCLADSGGALSDLGLALHLDLSVATVDLTLDLGSPPSNDMQGAQPPALDLEIDSDVNNVVASLGSQLGQVSLFGHHGFF